MKLTWTPDALSFIEQSGLDPQLVEDVVRAPQQVDEDPHSGDVDYPIKRMRRGDVIVVVGFRDPEEPAIIFVHLATPDDSTTHRRSGGGGGGVGRPGVPIPDTPSKVLRLVQEMGYEIRYGKHYQLYRDGEFVTSLATTPSDRHSIKAAWRTVVQYEAEHPREDKK